MPDNNTDGVIHTSFSSLALLPGNRLALVRSFFDKDRKSRLVLWDTISGSQIWQIDNESGSDGYSIVVSPSGRLAAVQTQDAIVCS